MWMIKLIRLMVWLKNDINEIMCDECLYSESTERVIPWMQHSPKNICYITFFVNHVKTFMEELAGIKVLIVWECFRFSIAPCCFFRDESTWYSFVGGVYSVQKKLYQVKSRNLDIQQILVITKIFITTPLTMVECHLD